MPNVILKDENGEPITYYNVRSVTIPNDQGLAATFNFGIPDATPNWESFNAFLNSSVSSSSGALAATVYSGHNYKLVGGQTYPDFGVWLVTPYDAVQLFADRGQWTHFIPCKGGVLISSANTNFGSTCYGVYYYDEQEMTVRKITNTGWSYAKNYYLQLEHGIAIWSSYGHCLYIDDETKAVTPINTTQYSTVSAYRIPEGLCLASASGTSAPIFIFYENTKNIVKTSSVFTYLKMVKVKDDYYVFVNTQYGQYMQLVRPSLGEITQLPVVVGCFGKVYEYEDFIFFCSTSSSYNYGCYVLDRETMEFSRICERGCCFDNKTETEHGVLFYSTSSSSTYYGYVYFDYVTKRGVYYQTNTYYWNKAIPYGDGLLIASSSTSGIRYLDYETLTDRQVFGSYANWSYAYYDTDNNCGLVIGTGSSSGVLLIDNTTMTGTRIYTQYYFNALVPCGNKVFIGSSNYNGLYVYDRTTKTVTKDPNITTYLGKMMEVPGGCLLIGTSYSNSGNDGSIYFYDPDEDTLTKLVAGYPTSNVVDMGDYLILLASCYSSYNAGIRLYEKATKTIRSVYSSGYSYTKFLEDENFIIFCSSGGGLIYFNKTTKTAKNINSSFSTPSYIGYRRVAGGILFWYNNYNSTSGPFGLYFFNYETEKMTQVYSKGIRWTYFEETLGGYYIQMGDLKLYKRLFWDNETKTITEA